eukprot:GHRQ01033396.1.p1 GENE.GHRQ01033396.1~~GHRQ01033396.1.p1  ORF type:complete len:123 (+),score=17.20 GHRQ01033396.1:49-417(+)
MSTSGEWWVTTAAAAVALLAAMSCARGPCYPSSPPPSKSCADGDCCNAGNWHSTVAECFISYGILTDNRERYDKGVSLYHDTLSDYLKWGRGANAEGGRMIGECSETLRDIFHSQFGFGGCS